MLSFNFDNVSVESIGSETLDNELILEDDDDYHDYSCVYFKNGKYFTKKNEKEVRNPWIIHVSKFSQKHALTYSEALRHPDVKKDYKYKGKYYYKDGGEVSNPWHIKVFKYVKKNNVTFKQALCELKCENSSVEVRQCSGNTPEKRCQRQTFCNKDGTKDHVTDKKENQFYCFQHQEQKSEKNNNCDKEDCDSKGRLGKWFLGLSIVMAMVFITFLLSHDIVVTSNVMNLLPHYTVTSNIMKIENTEEVKAVFRGLKGLSKVLLHNGNGVSTSDANKEVQLAFQTLAESNERHSTNFYTVNVQFVDFNLVRNIESDDKVIGMYGIYEINEEGFVTEIVV